MKRQQGGPEGILLIDKPAGWTSHDVVAKVRRLAGQRRIGHTGTLDPAATGLLVLCLGRATRLVEYLAGHGKRYTGEIALGSRTDTDDAEGDVIETRPVPELTLAKLRELEAAFSGGIEQVPPAYSAIKVGGQKAYAAARKGNPLELKARSVRIETLHLRQVDADRLALEMECSAGTYVRSLARDIGEALGCGAHLASLRRTRAGAFDVEEAWTLDGLAAALEEQPVEELLLPPDVGLLELDVALVEKPEPGPVHVLHGREKHTEVLRVYGGDGDFLGTGSVDEGGMFRPLKVFLAPQPVESDS